MLNKLCVLLLSLLISHQSYAFQVTCASQGYWTGQAINEMTRLQSVLTELRDDPNCKGIESVVADMESARVIMKQHDLPYGKNADRFMSLPSEIASLYTYIQSGGTSGLLENARSLLVNKVLGMAAAQNNVGVEAPGAAPKTDGEASPVDDAQLSWQAMQERTRATSLVGMTMMQKVFEVLPNYEQCVSNRPNQGLAIVSAAITMFAAFASGDAGSTQEMARTLSSFVTYMRNVKFGQAIGQLKQMEYWSNLSCLLESTSNVYCNVKDSYALLDYQNPGYRYQPVPVASVPDKSAAKPTPDKPAGELSAAEMAKLSNPDHPLHGYYIMVREIPTISRWLQEVQFGIEPKMKQDADFKNATLTTMTNFLAAINNIKAIFNEKMVIYQRTTDPNARRNQLFSLLKELVDNQILGRMGEENFFTMAVPERKLPFFLVGYQSVPEEVLPNQYRTHSANWSDWMENGGLYRKEWDDPDALLTILRSNLWQLMDNASELGSNWFRLRFNVDPINLVSRSVTDPNITAVESLVSIYGYLGRLAERLSHDTDKNYVVLPDIIDTIDRIQKVLGEFQEMRKLTKQYFPGVTNPEELGLRIANMSPEEKKKIANTAGEILTTAYIQFNIILQRDTFLANRLNTLVMYDYSDRVRRKEGMSDYVHDLMVVTGRTMMDRMVQAQGTNPNQVKTDLDTSSTLLATNFEVMEEMFGDDFEAYLNTLLTKAGGLYFQPGGFMSPGMFVTLPGDDNGNHSFDQVKARICTQTLLFKNFERYRNYCYETTLRSQFDDSIYQVPKRVAYGVEAIFNALTRLGPATTKLVHQARLIEQDGKVIEAPVDTLSEKLSVASRIFTDESVFRKTIAGPEPFHLSLAYDELHKTRFETRRKFGYEQVCLIRDFLRKNEVFWLTKQFEDQQMDRFVQIQELEKHWNALEAEQRRKANLEAAPKIGTPKTGLPKVGPGVGPAAPGPGEPGAKSPGPGEPGAMSPGPGEPGPVGAAQRAPSPIQPGRDSHSPVQPPGQGPAPGRTTEDQDNFPTNPTPGTRTPPPRTDPDAGADSAADTAAGDTSRSPAPVTNPRPIGNPPTAPGSDGGSDGNSNGGLGPD